MKAALFGFKKMCGKNQNKQLFIWNQYCHLVVKAHHNIEKSLAWFDIISHIVHTNALLARVYAKHYGTK